MAAVTFVLLSLIPASLALITIPPLISQQPDKLIVFQIGFAVQLPCVATGNPPPKYIWTYNDLAYSTTATDNRVQQLPGVGTIIINDPRTNDQGYYKCRASNDFGIAVANTILLLNASLDSFPRLDPLIVNTPLGNPLTFVCGQPSSFPYPIIYWQKLDVRLQAYISINYDARVAQDLDGRLHFSNIIQTDAGSYQCNVHNPVLRRTATSRINQIVVAGGSSTNMRPVSVIYSAPVNFVAYRGQLLRLKCIFGGMPTPFVQWLRGDGTAVNASYVAAYGLEVNIPSTSYNDAGTYECRGYNTASTNPGTATMKVVVYATPYFITMPTPQTRSIGDSVSFICQGAGIPQPTTRWYINGNLTVASKGKVILDGNNMTIVNLALEDAMAIQCNITDDNSGWEAVSFYINVLNEPPAIITPPPTLMKLADGSSYSIDCVVFGAPRPVISWQKDGRDLTGGRFVVFDNGTLEILDTLITDAGTYTCQAFNNIGRVSASMTVIVRSRTQIRTTPQDTVVYAGQETKFTCTAITDGDEMQNLVINWQKDGQWIDYTTAQRMYKNTQDNSLLISGTISLDTGTYTCVASNGVDSASASAALRVQDVPDQPTAVTIMECYQTTARVSWKPGPNNNAPILNYILQFNTTFDPSVWYTVNSSISDKDNVYIVPLSPYVNYTFRVLARNKIGTSLPSYPGNQVCTTQSAVPTTNPTGVKTLNEDPSWLVVTWQPTAVIDQNGQGFRYLITYKKWDPNQSKFVCSPPNQCSQTFVPQDSARGVPGQDRYIETKIYIRGVDTYAPYLIYITTANEKGSSTGPLNKIVGFSGEGSPGVSVIDLRTDPTLPPTSTSASFVWTQVNTNASAILGFFRGYRIRYWKSNPTDTNEVILKATVYIILRDVRLEGRDYNINAEATSRKRRSADDTYHSLQAADDSGEHDDYVSVVARTRRDATSSVSVNGSLVYATVYNLPPYSQLNFEVAVINKKYSGPDSPPLLVQTLTGYPGPVAGLTVTERGPTHVVLLWQPPTEPNGQLKGYRIGFRTLDHLLLGPMQFPDTKDFDAATTSTKVTGLHYTQRYRFSIWAYTIAGQGDEYFIDDSTVAPGYPGPPTPSVVSIPNCNNCLNVSWVPATTGTPASVFYVQYRQKSALDNWQSTMYEPYKSWIKLMNLASGWVYEVRVVASNGDGYETTSASLTINPSGELRSSEEAKDVFSSPWFIGVLIGATLLAIVIVLVFIVQQNKGGRYMAIDTTETEKLRPFDDHGADARVYEDDRPARPRNAHIDNGSPVKDIDPDEYHDENPAQFGEQASYIGAYGRKDADLGGGAQRYPQPAPRNDPYSERAPRGAETPSQGSYSVPQGRYYQPPPESDTSSRPAYTRPYQPRYNPPEQVDVRYHAASPSADDGSHTIV